MDIEQRFIEFRTVKVGGSDGPIAISGTVIPYGRMAVIGGKFREEFRAGAFTAGLDDAILNLMHDRAKPVARIGSGLKLTDTDNELRADIEFPDTVYGREAAQLVETRMLRGFSVGFRAIKQDWQGPKRLITEAHLDHIALVDRPAYTGAQIAERMEERYGLQRRGSVRFYF